MFPICGKKPVKEALSANTRPYQFKQLWLASGLKEDAGVKQILQLANRKSLPLRRTEARDLDHWAPGFSNHQGVVLLLAEPPCSDSLDELLSDAKKQDSALLVALDCVNDHQNIGSIARSAAAFGALGLIAPQDRAAPLIHPAVWRVAQGAVEHLKLSAVVNLSRALARLKEEDFWIVGASEAADAKDPREMAGSWPKKVCLVLGSEAGGIRRLVGESCDLHVAIPQRQPGSLDSLNLASAAAVLLWEIFRGR